MKLSNFKIVLAFIMSFSVYADPPSIGNFALPFSQQPGPLVSMGENILDKNLVQLYVYADTFQGAAQHTTDIIPAALIALRDDFSVFYNVPYAVSYQMDANHSSGFEDLILQFEYAYYTNKTSTLIEQATLIANITGPTGSTQKQPPTGAGSPTFLLGATVNRTYADWFFFASDGVVLTTARAGTKTGNNFLYQAGFGRNILSIEKSFILAWMLEIDGQYSNKNTVEHTIDPNSGGNVITVTPSLWISTQKLICQLGFGLPAVQHLFGDQNKNHYSLIANFGWTL